LRWGLKTNQDGSQSKNGAIFTDSRLRYAQVDRDCSDESERKWTLARTFKAAENEKLQMFQENFTKGLIDCGFYNISAQPINNFTYRHVIYNISTEQLQDLLKVVSMLFNLCVGNHVY
jgi:hypothetical protein